MLFSRMGAAAQRISAANAAGYNLGQTPSGLSVAQRPELRVISGGANQPVAQQQQPVQFRLDASAANRFGLPVDSVLTLDDNGSLIANGTVVGRAANVNGQAYLAGDGAVDPKRRGDAAYMMGLGRVGAGPLMLGGYVVQDVHDPSELPTYLAGYKNNKFRHSEMCQIVPVERDQDKYRTFDKSSAFRATRVKTTDTSSIPEVSFPSANSQFTALVRRIGAFIPDPVRDQAKKSWDVILTNLRHCRRMIDLDLEMDVMGPTGLLTTAGNWASGYAVTLGSGLQWGGTSGPGTSSDPIADLEGLVIRSTQDVTGFYMNQRVAFAFLRHHTVRDHLRSMIGDSALDAATTKISNAREPTNFTIPGIGDFHVTTAKIETSTGIDFIQPDCVVAVTQPPGVPTNGEDIATAYSFRVAMEDGPDAGTGYGVRMVRVETRGAGGTLVIVEEKSAQVFTGTNCGGALFDVLQ